MDNDPELKWVAVDLDGCLAESVWPDRGIGQPIERNIIKLLEVDKAGYKIIIHTARPWSDYALIENWLNKYHLPFRRIVPGKILAMKYVDDRALNSESESWL